MKIRVFVMLALGVVVPFAVAAPKESSGDMKKSPAKEESGEKTVAEKRAEAEAAKLEASKKLAESLSAEQRTKLLQLLNSGDAKALEEIDGIGAKRAASIIAKRPYGAVEDLAKADDIGEKTFANVIRFGKGEQPVAPKKEAKGEPKAETRKKM